MSRSYDFLISALRSLPEKPSDDAAQSAKKGYSERMSAVIASALAEELRQRGLIGTRPSSPGDEAGVSGAERRMSGGIGAKKVDVTWSTEQSGLQLAFSVKCINFKDRRGRNYQKNVVNRRGDMLFESVTLHRRFPYAVLGGFMLLDRGAAEDTSNRRSSTFVNTHKRLRLFSGRSDPAGRDEQYERLYVALIEATPFAASARLFQAGDSEREVQLDSALDELLVLVAERNPDFYEFVDGRLRRVQP